MQTSVSESLSFFNRFGASKALFTWLQFRVFLSDPAWQSRLPTDCRLPGLTVRDALQSWSDHNAEPQLHSLFWVLLNIAALITGSSAMIAALSYPGNEPVNLWVIFGLFAVLPLLLTLVSALGALLQRNSRSNRVGLSGLLVKLLRIPEQWLPYGRLLISWTLWQSQSLALLFNVGALAGFFLVALFRDIAFGWSSTLIEETASMVSLFKFFSAPWSMLVPVPADDVISATRFFQSQTLSLASAGRSWWPTVVMAVLFYGVLPRFLLQQWLSIRFRKTLRKDITSSGEVERFLNGCQRVSSDEAAVLAEPDCVQQTMQAIELDSTEYSFIGWQKSLQSDRLVYQLGLNSWQQDVQWIEGSAALAQPIIILVRVHQTPTGELADCIELLREQGKEPAIGLLAESADASSGAFRSWQYFVQQHKLALSTVMEPQNV